MERLAQEKDTIKKQMRLRQKEVKYERDELANSLRNIQVTNKFQVLGQLKSESPSPKASPQSLKPSAEGVVVNSVSSYTVDNSKI